MNFTRRIFRNYLVANPDEMFGISSCRCPIAGVFGFTHVDDTLFLCGGGDKHVMPPWASDFVVAFDRYATKRASDNLGRGRAMPQVSARVALRILDSLPKKQ